MTSRDFCFWLQGFIEVSEPLTISNAQLDQIKKHLALVFAHEIDPPMGPKVELDKIHGSVGTAVGGEFSEIIMRC